MKSNFWLLKLSNPKLDELYPLSRHHINIFPKKLMEFDGKLPEIDKKENSYFIREQTQQN